MSRPPRRRRWKLAVAAIAFGCGVAIAGVELVLRLVDPLGLNYEVEVARYRTEALQFAWEAHPGTPPDLDGRIYWHKPGLDLDLGSFTLRTNALGLRGPAVIVPKPEDTFRVLLLGDSVAFGWGVDDEVSFARRLEREWNAATPAPSRRLEVVNTGHPMYDTNQEEATLRELGPTLQPDLVVLLYVVNDVEPTRDVVEATLTGKDPHPEEAVVIPDDAWSTLQGWLTPVLPATARLVGMRSDLQARVRRTLPPGTTYQPERFGKGPRGWARSQAALLRIRDWCLAAKVPLVLFDHTLPRLEALAPFCAEQGIPHEPLWFDEADHALGIINSPLDSHANARGHGLLLERLRAALLRRGLLPR